MPNFEHAKLFARNGLPFRRCFGSKSAYFMRNPEDRIVFNSRIYTASYYAAQPERVRDWHMGQEGEIWYGDLNLTKDDKTLQDIVNELDFPVIITYESGRIAQEYEPDRK